MPPPAQRTAHDWQLSGLRAAAAAQALSAVLLLIETDAPPGPPEFIVAVRRVCEAAAAAVGRLSAASAEDAGAAAAARTVARGLEHCTFLLAAVVQYMGALPGGGACFARLLPPEAVRTHLHACARAARQFPGVCAAGVGLGRLHAGSRL